MAIGVLFVHFNTDQKGESELKMSRPRGKVLYFLASFIILLLPALSFAQSLTTGDIAGAVTDSSKAVVPNARVVLRSLDSGASQAAETNQAGEFRFPLLKPGRYTVTVSRAGFQSAGRQVEVAVGQVATVNVALEIGQTTQTIEVSEAGALLNPEPSMNTSFTPAQLQQLPSAGGDITNIAFTAPGVVVNNTGGYGNFTVNGLPATSNLFTVNGENNMDPYFNTNNSGASNMTIGQNELQEATVTANAYGGQYGQLSGAQVTYVTMSGTNEFHGNAIWWWNGRAMNSNNWFNNFYGDPRPFSNANQWAARIGGPIRRNKTFFFVDNEGLRFVLPNVVPVTVPTPAFSTAVLNNIQAKRPAEYNAYKTMLGLWAAAPGAANAQPIANSSYCNSLVLPGFDPATQRCAAKFQATPNALGSEWILSARVDQKLTDNDTAFFRYRGDHGLQPTHLDPINSNFNAISSQPSWDTQFQETHVFGARATNQFTASLSHYVAQFQQNAEQVASTFPYGIITSGAVPFTGFNEQYYFPQGRNITQYQFIDDYTRSMGSHTLKFGANFRRYDVSDHTFFFTSPAVYYGYTSNGLQNFADGLAYQYRQSLNIANDVPVAMYGLHLYAMDEWNVKPNFKLTLTLAAERASNPVCQFNCFANFKAPWNSLASATSSNPGGVPYSSDIAAGQHSVFPGVDKIDLAPRVGFSWSPTSDRKLVVSGGFGIFYDALPAGLVDNMLANPPVAIGIRVRPSAGTAPFDPAGGPATWAASANAFSLQQTYSQIATTLTKLGSSFAAPSFISVAGTMHAPRWEEWNLQIQRQLTNTTVLQVNYVGNHGGNIPYSTAWPNAYDQYGVFPGVAGVPAKVPVANYGTVTQYQSGAISNYDGLTVSVSKRFANWFSGRVNYTWAHNLDEGSNGGVFTYGDSLLGQINPLSLRANNYGNSDYDIRSNFSADWMVNPTIRGGSPLLRHIVNGWQWSGKWFWRSGLPFSVTDANWVLGNGGGTLMATPLGQGWGQTSCGAAAAVTPCINSGAYLDSAAESFNGYTAWSGQNRNQMRGPGFFDIDMNLYRAFRLREGMNLGIGVQAFNVFNHPNFANPDSGLGDATFGKISEMANSPTSPYGTFLGFDSSVRVVQLSAKITF